LPDSPFTGASQGFRELPQAVESRARVRSTAASGRILPRILPRAARQRTETAITG